MLTEGAARWLLVLHLALGVAAVGAATHLALWLRPYLRGEFARHRSVRRFAVLAFVLHGCGFFAGQLVYPTYRVEVRAAYLENSGAIARAVEAHAAEVKTLATKEAVGAPIGPSASDAIERAGRAARWFDVKEHWVALGLFGSAGLLLLLMFWDPRRDDPAPAPVAFWLAIVVAGTLWFAAIIGVVTATWRAI